MKYNEFTAFLKYGEGTGEITDYLVPAHNNNISGEASDLNYLSDGLDFFEFGVTPIGNGMKFASQNEFEGIVTEARADEDGDCEITFVGEGEDIDDVVAIFNKVADKYPLECELVGYLNDTEIYRQTLELNRETYIFRNIGGADTVELTVKRWNTPNGHIMMTSFYIGDGETFEKAYIKSVATYSDLVSTTDAPSFGVTVADGTIIMNDIDDYLKYLLQRKILTKTTKLTLYFNHVVVGTYNIEKMNYDRSTKQLSIPIYDDLENLENGAFAGIALPQALSDVTPTTGYRLLGTIMGYTGTDAEIEAQVAENFDMTTAVETRLKSIVVGFPYMVSSATRKAVDKWGMMTSCAIKQNASGAKEIIFLDRKTLGSSVVKIDKYYTKTAEFLSDNEVKKVEINEIYNATEDMDFVEDYSGNIYNTVSSIYTVWPNGDFSDFSGNTYDEYYSKGTIYEVDIMYYPEFTKTYDVSDFGSSFTDDDLNDFSIVARTNTKKISEVFVGDTTTTTTTSTTSLLGLETGNSVYTSRIDASLSGTTLTLTILAVARDYEGAYSGSTLVSRYANYAESVSLQIYYKGIVLGEQTVIFGDEDSNESYAITDNELMSSETKIDGVPITTDFANRILDIWGNGRRVVVATQPLDTWKDIDDDIVYDEDGEEKWLIELNDDAEFFHLGECEETDSDGNNMPFEAVGRDITFKNGISKQKITYIEAIEEESE